MMQQKPAAGRFAPSVGRIPVVDVRPEVDGGRRPARAVPGELFEVSATVFREGHDAVGANVVLTGPDGAEGEWTPMRLLAPGTDRYAAGVRAEREGDWTFRVEAWSDPVATWRHAADVKVPSGIDVELTLQEGALLLERAADSFTARERAPLTTAARTLRDTRLSPEKRLAAASGPVVTALLNARPLRELVTRSREFPLRVDRERALYGAWYEMFPRSEGALVPAAGTGTAAEPPRSGTLRTAAKRLEAVADMGFDVVYLPPVHPIGTTHRKGADNALVAGPYDPGSPWAIGSADGGHDAIHPDLGTLDDFDHFVGRAGELGLEVALDFALQCSPDHPWLTEHPEWFRRRADGSLAHAENPPKKYEDIHPVDFDTDPDGLHAECLRILRHWMAHGVRIFRVDNPHTKPVGFWERLIDAVHATDPDVLFLAEAFTRPAMLHTLARIGFHQSYTYFTWRNSKVEVESYLSELAGLGGEEAAAYLRPNLFVNTPDILHAYLQYGGRPAFAVRAVLAAMAGPTWGMYAGYELYENVPAGPGSEEYLHSEKYRYRPRDWEAHEAAGDSLAPLVRTLNALRRAHPALHQLRNLRFHHTDNDAVVCFSKRDDTDWVLVVLNLDPHGVREATVSLDLPALGLDRSDTFAVCDALSGETWQWGRDNYVRLDPQQHVAHILTDGNPQP
ncbi:MULTISPECIES: alpha-1,4-glucan--maltose-1-phosphate maltosyltransferase [unclassified Streptomyces]|uniref:alpha-1,4-glucan--maltose-1-phosphate maltosyltransferase n=1 Tax=unclassified Streptomyces TaxID=2593676 RepID=UPI000F6DE503|nr:alpha-1,4-glucan--maltose-1-phosphate maltosyltransferase [Streptomyces sp. WAC 01420]AZM60764.1 alpha-1,4-glucan--maltose-1-phosphate maltosyltransferase [Streptomyces sp. WAC 01438]RSM96954.1 alpha-1,4-glucan--maltose-1-phosphate maltosyltransferase [Streptomyces sp. WAC 01420]